MKVNNITIQKLFHWYLYILLVIAFSSLLTFSIIPTLIFWLMTTVPLIYIVTKHKGRYVITEGIIYFVIGIVLVLVTFRKARAFLQPPSITKTKIVGFAQFFGYSLSFDNYIFFIFIISPFIIYSIIYFRKKYLEK